MPADPPRQRPAKPRKERLGGRAVLAVVLVLAVLVGGGWVAAYELAGDKLRHGTEVAGVDIGDRTPDEATRVLESALADRTARPITVVVDGRRVSVDPAEAGLSLDAAATVASGAAARSWDPVDLWNHYTDGTDLDPVVRLDDSRLAKVARRLDRRLGSPARNGAVRMSGGRVAVTDPVAGRAVDVGELGDALRSAYLATDRTVDLTLHEVRPAIDSDDVQRAVDEVANPAMTGPVTLVFGRSPVVLRPQQLGRVLRLEPSAGSLEPTVDATALRRVLGRALAADAKAPVDATVRLVKGKPRVIPAKPGVTYDAKQVERVLLDLVTRGSGHRKARVKARVKEPSFTTADARRLRIRQRVSTFTTSFPYAEYRNVNIGRAAELVDGTVLKPGETFSLNGIVGERTRANGFTEGWTIQNGVFRSDLGGGVSQLATTTFNAMFFAGLQDVEHKPHSLYISRYPIGREATVAWPSVDLKFKNDTPYGVLVHAVVTPSTPSSQGSVTVSMYSTKRWDITTRTGPRYAFTPYKKQTLTGNCETTSGADGFSIDVWRYFHKPGSSAVARTEKFHTTYIPQDEVDCR